MSTAPSFDRESKEPWWGYESIKNERSPGGDVPPKPISFEWADRPGYGAFQYRLLMRKPKPPRPKSDIPQKAYPEALPYGPPRESTVPKTTGGDRRARNYYYMLKKYKRRRRYRDYNPMFAQIGRAHARRQQFLARARQSTVPATTHQKRRSTNELPEAFWYTTPRNAAHYYRSYTDVANPRLSNYGRETDSSIPMSSSSIPLSGSGLSSPCPSIDEIARKSDRFPFSDANLRTVMEGKARIMTYRTLMDCNDLEEVLGEHGAVIILYETRPNYGHWCCMYSAAPGLIEFFDPYGFPPDSQLQYCKGMNVYPVLEDMFKRAGVRCHWSSAKFQKESDSVSTCGRWCSLRIALREINPKAFEEMFLSKRNKLPPDTYATLLTMFVNLFTPSSHE